MTNTGKVRVTVHKNQIIIYERLGPDVETLIAIFGNLSALESDIVKMRLQEQLEKMARFSPILRFILIDPAMPISRFGSISGSQESWKN
jgi:hypothetical protein